MKRITAIRRWVAGCLLLLVAGAGLSAADKVWQTGTWRDMKVERPKFVFGAAPRDPSGSTHSAPAAAVEKRTFVIETADTRYEIRQDATTETPRLDITIGDSVTFAVEKNNIWIKDSQGHEHAMKITKKKSI